MKRFAVAAVAAASLLVVGMAFAAGPDLMDEAKMVGFDPATHTVKLNDGKTLVVPENISLGRTRGEYTTWLYHKAPDGKLILDGYMPDGF